MIVTDKAVEQALNELALLDDKEAELRANKEWGEDEKKRIHSVHFLNATGSVAEREARAKTHPEYIKHVEKLRETTRDYQTAKNRRDRLTMLVEIYRTESANRRQRT